MKSMANVGEVKRSHNQLFFTYSMIKSNVIERLLFGLLSYLGFSHRERNQTLRNRITQKRKIGATHLTI
jgi:hypothetical protein